MKIEIPDQELLERFCRYIKIDTQSDQNSETLPSSAKQLDLSRLLVDELEEMGLSNVELTPTGYVFATLPANSIKQVPEIGFLAHVDTSPDVSGENVTPVVHRNYQGGDIILPGDPTQVLRPEDCDHLGERIGHDIITSDGTTLLGADNKAGIAEIMTALYYLLVHPEIAHGNLHIAFTVDEEIGSSAHNFDTERFGAEFAYTIDGGPAGEVEDETFCADTLTVTLRGINMHPGYAKGKMLNSQRVAAELVNCLPPGTMSPETTDGREGYIHLQSSLGSVEQTVLTFLLRDFEINGLNRKKALISAILEQLNNQYPGLDYTIEIEESYRNMKFILDDHPQVIEFAMEAISRTGQTPSKSAVRGGTDGAKLSYLGLPTPNLFTGGHNFHSKLEWSSLQDMVKATETIVHLATIWEERA